MKRWPREKAEDSGPPNPSFQGYPRFSISTGLFLKLSDMLAIR